MGISSKKIGLNPLPRREEGCGNCGNALNGLGCGKVVAQRLVMAGIDPL